VSQAQAGEAFGGADSGVEWDYISDVYMQLMDSAPIQTGGHYRLSCISDLDSDGALDAVVCSSASTAEYRIVERVGDTWVHRRTISEERVTTGDVDGDGILELVSAPTRDRVRVYKATADNTYSLIYEYYVGYFVENIAIGDANGNGINEVLIARETTPVKIYSFEWQPPSGFAALPTVTAYERNAETNGVADTNNNGQPDHIFGCYDLRRYTYITEGETVLAQLPDFWVSYIADTNANGIPELIGRVVTPDGSFNWNYSPEWKIYEFTGTEYELVSSAISVSYVPLDIDGDGDHEFRRLETGTPGHNNRVRFYERDGETLSELWDSRMMFLSQDANVTWMDSVGDLDGDGKNEVALLQGQTLHIIEQQEGPELPTTSITGKVLLAVALVILASALLMGRGNIASLR